MIISELRLPPKATTTPTPHVHTTPKPRRKQHNNKAGHDTGKPKSDPGLINGIQENELVSGISSEGKFNFYILLAVVIQFRLKPCTNSVLTQIPSAKSSNNNMEKSRNAQMPASVPSSKTQQTWISHNSGGANTVVLFWHSNTRHVMLNSILYLTLFTELFLLFRSLLTPTMFFVSPL